MPNIETPSKPVIEGGTLTVKPVSGATKYNLYRLRFMHIFSNFLLADGSILITSDDKIFNAAEAND